MTVLMLGLTRKRGAVAEEQVFAATPSRAHLTNWPGAAQILQLIIYNKERLIFQKWPIFHVFEMPLACLNRSYLCGFRNVGVFLLEIGKACFRNASAFVPRRHSWDFFFLLNTFKATTDDFPTHVQQRRWMLSKHVGQIWLCIPFSLDFLNFSPENLHMLND